MSPAYHTLANYCTTTDTGLHVVEDNEIPKGDILDIKMISYNPISPIFLGKCVVIISSLFTTGNLMLFMKLLVRTRTGTLLVLHPINSIDPQSSLPPVIIESVSYMYSILESARAFSFFIRKICEENVGSHSHLPYS